MRRILSSIMLFAAVICAGCAMLLEETPPPSRRPMPQPVQVDLTPIIEIEAPLYFLNRNQTKLEREMRTIEIAQNGSPEFAIVQALTDGPDSDTLLPVGIGFSAERVEVMPDLINVYLRRSSGSVRQWSLTVFKLALSASLIDYSGVRYVNVLVNDEAPGYTVAGSDTVLPTGVLSRPGELTEELSMLAQRSSGVTYDAYVALYFLDQSESWLLPEIRRITLDPDSDSVNTVVQALASGPSNRYSLRRSLGGDIRLEEYEFIDSPDGRLLRLVFNRMPTVYTSSFVNGEEMAGASLAYTLSGFIPGVDGVQLKDRDDPERTITCLPADYAELIGNRVTVCLPNTPDGATMVNVARIVPQARCNDLYMILSMLFSGPTEGDAREVWPAAPADVSVKSILDVYRARDIIVVNLDGTVSPALREAGAHDEQVLLFAIVNTLTSIKGVRSVMFLEEGERREYVGAETVCILDPLMRNPGIIR